MNSLFNIKSFLKFLSRNKTYTAIDIFGLSVSLMFVILIAVYTVRELSVDKYHTDGDRIYVLNSDIGPVSGLPIAYRLQERYPEIEKVCHVVTRVFDNTPLQKGEMNMTANLMLADTTFFDFFSFPLVRGNKKAVLEARNSAVISESFANRYFGNEDPMGKPIRINDRLSLTVNGIMKDISNSVIPYGDILFRIDNIHALAGDEGMFGNYNSYGGTNVFVMERRGAA